MNILYICSPSIIDVKWMSFFSTKKSNKVYMITLMPNKKYLTDSFKQLLIEHNIKLLEPLDSYSLGSPLTLIKNITRLNKHIKNLRIDLLHVMFSSPYALWINHVTIPSIITNRGSDILIVIKELSKKTDIKSRIHYWLTKKAFKKAYFITGVSHKTIEEINLQFNIKANLIRTGIQVDLVAHSFLSERTLPELKNRKIIFFPRSILPLYNTDIQIAAIRLLPENIRSEYLFVFVRGMTINKEYQQKIRLELDSINNLEYKIYDYLSQQEMWAIYNAASITISMPQSDGTPSSPLEAMAASCPLIMGSIQLDKDLFNANLYLELKTDTPLELSNSIQLALTNYPTNKIKLALENVRKNANWSHEMTKLELLYDKILKN